MKGRAFLFRLGFARAGIVECWRREASFRSQCRLAIFATAFLLIARLAAAWVALVALSAAVVLALEAANAALEELADTLHPGIAPGIGRAKDMAAGAVLVASLGAGAVGLACAYSVFS